MEVSEFLEKNLNLEDAVKALAGRKARAAAEGAKLLKVQNILILGADTIVELAGRVFGKPESADEAVEILGTLSGNTHRVITAIALFDPDRGREILDACTSYVTFRKLTSLEIADYIASGDPMDKAGAYGIQGQARQFISKFEGPIDNVMGLSVETLEKCLARGGWSVERN